MSMENLFVRQWEAGNERCLGVVLPTEAGAFLIIHRILLTALGEGITNHQQSSTTLGPLSADQARAALMTALEQETDQTTALETVVVEGQPAGLAEPSPPQELPVLQEERGSEKARREALAKALRAAYDRSGLTGKEIGDLFLTSRANYRKWMTGNIPRGWLEPLERFTQAALVAVDRFPTPFAARAWLLADANGKRSPYELLKQEQYAEFAARVAAIQAANGQQSAQSIKEAINTIQQRSGLSTRSIAVLARASFAQFNSWLRGEDTRRDSPAAQRLLAMARTMDEAHAHFSSARELYYWLLTPQDKEQTPYQILQDGQYEEFLKRAGNARAAAKV